MGLVSLQLLGRARPHVGNRPPHVTLVHEREDVEKPERTPDLVQAAALLRRLPESEGLLHAVVRVADEEWDFPLDPWAYTDLDERGLPRWSEDIRYYELDTEGFAEGVAEAMVELLPELVVEDEESGLVASCRRAVSLLRRDLEPALREYEEGELTLLLEAARELREKLEAVTRDLLAEQDEVGEPSLPSV